MKSVGQTLRNLVEGIACRKTAPESPLFRAETTRLFALLTVESILALLSLVFATQDWMAGARAAAVLEVASGIALLLMTPLFRRYLPPAAVDMAELGLIAVLILGITFQVFPLDAMVATLVPLFPLIASLLRWREGWPWTIAFLPLHLLVSLAGVIAARGHIGLFMLTAWSRDIQPITQRAMLYTLAGSYLIYVVVAWLSRVFVVIAEGYALAWQEAALKDPLTGALNRLAFEEIYRDHCIPQEGNPLPRIGLILLDIDDFKGINDQFGHNAGDAVLREMAALLRRSLRITDHLVRWGGEEFLILLPRTNLQGAHELAERLRMKVATHVFPVERKVTASFGVTVLTAGDTPETFVRRADESLYRAKERGKNRVEYLHPEVPISNKALGMTSA